MEECPVCYDKYTETVRKQVDCSFCKKSLCKVCLKKYILSTFQDPHCMHCKTLLDREFLVEHLSNSFITGELRKHREQVLFDREKSLMPATVQYVEIMKNIEILKTNLHEQTKKVEEVKNMPDYLKYYGVKMEYSNKDKEIYKDFCKKKEKDKRELNSIYIKEREKLRQEIEKITKKTPVVKVLRAEEKKCKQIRKNIFLHTRAYKSNDPQAILSGTVTVLEEDVKRRRFIRACPADGCKGFLSQQWHCGVCECWVCPDCHEIKDGGKDDLAHECKKENIETAKLLAKDTRPCPNCAAQIFKIVGCDQMFCTACNTPFSWSKGEVISSGRVHNPHYFEWMNSQKGSGAGAAAAPERSAGDIPCGDVPVHDIFWYEFRKIENSGKRTPYDFGLLPVIFRVIYHIRYAEIDRLPSRDILPEDNRDYRVRYLMNKLTDQRFKQCIQRSEKKREMGIALRMVYEMFVIAACDILRGVLDEKTRKLRTEKEWMSEFEGLRVYTNECLMKISKLYNSSVEMIHLKKKGLEDYSWQIRLQKWNDDATTVTAAAEKISPVASTETPASQQTNQFVGAGLLPSEAEEDSEDE